MAKYIGKEHITKELNMLKERNSNTYKGLSAEIELGDFLERNLSEDTYIIAHPQIGKYDPDIIVVSPHYGFRVIEIKNWDIGTVQNIESNGNFTFKNNSSANPISQAKKHRDELREYLGRNHGIHTTTIDCVVVHFGISSMDVYKRFKHNLNDDFFKFNIFKEQLDDRIEDLIKEGTKFRITGCTRERIDKVVDSIDISKNIVSDEYFELRIKKQEEKTVKKLSYIIIIMLAIVLVGLGTIFMWDTGVSQNSSKIDTSLEEPYISILELVESEDRIGEEFKSGYWVKEFDYSSTSETKFLVLSDEDDTIKGIIFKNTPNVPYIEVGKFYEIEGRLNSDYEIIIDSIKLNEDVRSFHF